MGGGHFRIFGGRAVLPLAYSHSSDSCRQFVQLGGGGMINLLRYLDSIVDCNKKKKVFSEVVCNIFIISYLVSTFP